MAKVKASIQAKVKRKPIKPGSTMPKNIGGIVNARVVAYVKKK
jgi:hypothetical protein